MLHIIFNMQHFFYMRKFKNLMFIILALLPLLPIIAGVVSSIGEGTFLLSDGSFSIIENENGTISFVGDGTLYNNTIGLFLNSDVEYNGLIKALGSFALFLEANAGIPLSCITFYAFLYFVYSFVIFILGFVFDFLTFVPKKCSEVFSL